MYLSLNGKLIKRQAGSVSPLGEDFLYGFGLFETLKVSGGQVNFLTDHLNRMKKGCGVLQLFWPYGEEEIEGYCLSLLEANEIASGAVRISYSKGSSDNNLLITTRETNYTKDIYARGFKVCFSSQKRNPHSLLVGIKSNNYLENLLVFKDGKAKGYDEVIFLNIYDKLAEGAISNLFFVKDGIVYTPAADCGILPGIVRGIVISICKTQEIPCKIGSFTKDQLLAADEVFVTNSLVGIMPIALLEENSYKIESFKITVTLMKILQDMYK